MDNERYTKKQLKRYTTIEQYPQEGIYNLGNQHNKSRASDKA